MLSDLVLVLTWIDVWIWLVANVTGYNTSTFIFNRDETTFLGSYDSEDDALQELQFVLGGHSFPDLATHQYVYNVNHDTPTGASKVRRITAFTPGQVQRRDDFHWVGPHATKEYVDTEMQEAGQEVLDGLTANATQSTAELNTHAGDPNAHHMPGGMGGGLTPAEADALIATHAGMPNVHHVPGAGGIVIATTDPLPVGPTSIPGTIGQLSDAGHGHRQPTDSTLEYNASDELGVNVQDVIEHLQEHIQYHTASGDYSSSAGATVGQAYATSQYRKIITKVEVLLNPLVGADAFLVRLDELNADNSIKAKLFTSQTRSAPFGLGVAPRAFNFHDADGDIGVAIDGSIRLGILISRLGDNSDSAVAAVHGAEVSFGPRESYDDANADFDLENDVVYQHIDPAIGASTHSHGTDIRGNIKIFYTLIVDHGNLVGAPPELTPEMAVDATDETFGTVSGERLSQAVVAFSPPPTPGGGGGPNKVVSQIVTGTAPTSVNRADSGLMGSITPSSVTKKVLIQIAGGVLSTGGGTADDYALALQRGGADILVPAGLRARNFVGHISLTYLDSPASAAELTYGLFWGAVQGSLGASATSPMVMILEEVD